ncbi:MAG TPA: hypothetical protein VF835_04720 [Rhizomicrobium sp.]
MRDLLIVRTHLADRESLSAYDRYAALGYFDVVFCCDERRGPVDCGERSKVRFDNDRLAGLGLHPHRDCGWRCGDYFYYVTRTDRPDYSYYWMIEPDVLINWTDVTDFFAKFRDDTSDLLAAKFARRDWRWGWYNSMKNSYPAVYGCIFPVTRLSRPAIDHCFAARKSATARLKSTDWPNDESFVACELGNNGFVCSDLNIEDRVVYSARSFRNVAPHDAETLALRGADDLLYHPVGDFKGWLTELDAEVQKSPTVSRYAATQLNAAADILVDDPETLDAGLVPLILCSHAWAERAWSTKTKGTTDERDERKATNTAKKLAARFGAKKGRPLATVQVGTMRPRLRKAAVSSADDFVLGPPEPLRRFPARFALPYAFDFASRELLCTMHMNPDSVLDEPSLRSAQRRRVAVVARIPWPALDRLYGAPNDLPEPIFVFSIGLTGTVLLEDMVRSFGGRVVSEPDAIAQLAAEKDHVQRLPAKTRRQLVWHALSPFLLSSKDQSGPPPLVTFKARANAALAAIIETFPRARYVFVLQNRTAWARETYREFRSPPVATAHGLRQGLLALNVLWKSDVQKMIVRNEEIHSSPQAIASKLLEIPEHTTERITDESLVQSVADSRNGADTDEEEWLKSFDDVWRRIRPGKIIDALGLDIG